VVEVIVDRCAGLDVHKRTVVACVRSPGSGRQKRCSEVRTFGTFEVELLALRAWLVEQGVTQVAMEATGVFWKPVWSVLDDGAVFEAVLLVNPAHIKNVPGRKTDVNDAMWIGQLLECGLLRGSFVPPMELRELREITRYRRQLTEERGREVLRLQKLLEDANVKLSSVVTDTVGVTARMILEALSRRTRSGGTRRHGAATAASQDRPVAPMCPRPVQPVPRGDDPRAARSHRLPGAGDHSTR